MHPVIFTRSLGSNADGLDLEGAHYFGRIRAYADDILRVQIAASEAGLNKRSWSIDEAPMPAELSLAAEDESLVLRNGEGPELRIELAPFRWRWGDLDVLQVTGRRADAELDHPKAPEAVASWHHRARDAFQGLAHGRGLSLALGEAPGRQYFGLGERTGFLDKRGRVWTNWTTDEFRHGPNTDPLYQAHPFVMIRRGAETCGIFVDESWRTVFDLAATQRDVSLIHCDGPSLDLYLIPGPSPADVLRRYTGLLGRAPLPPLWALGFHQCRWGYPNVEVFRELARQYRSRGLPLDALWIDIDLLDGFRPLSVSRDRFPDFEEFLGELGEEGLRAVSIVDPAIKKYPGDAAYESGLAAGHFVRDARDDVLAGEVWPREVVWPDFTRAQVRAWWGELHRPYLDAGLAGIWNDMNEPAVFSIAKENKEHAQRALPLDARHGPRRHAEVHNVYGQEMSRATREALSAARPDKRPFVLTRSGFAGIHKQAFVWTGDNESSWEQLEGSIPMLLNLGLSGVPFCGADIGGFSRDSSGELLTRWTQLGVFYPFMRNHCNRDGRRQEPWSFGEPFSSAIAEALRLRYALLPTLYTLAHEAGRSGAPLMRPMFFAYPDDPELASIHDQFLFGPDLLVAPALRPGQRQRALYRPQGGWQDFFTGEARDQQAGWELATTPLERIPMLQRRGSAVALTADRLRAGSALWDPLIWRVAPGPDIRGEVYEDEGEGYEEGRWALLKGEEKDGQLSLDFEGVLAGRRVIVELAGREAPAECEAPFTVEDGVLRVTLEGPSVTMKWA